MAKYIGYSIIFAIFSFCTVCYAIESGRPIEVNGDQVEFFPNEKKVTAIGNVTIDYEGIKLSCNKIVVYTDTKDAEAEGDVVLVTPGGELKGNKVNYNFGTKQGLIVEASAHSGEWYGKGERIELLSTSAYKVVNGYITSCNLLKPHYKISSKSVLIYPENKVVAKEVTLKIGSLPIAYLPKYHFSLKTDWPTLNVTPGKKKKWGVFSLNSYRYEIDDKNKLTLRVDERERWGLAEGIDYKYGLDNFGTGLLKAYYTNQRDVDRNEPLRAEQERYRVQVRHRWDINNHATAIMEYHRLSDTNMTKDFFYREEYERESSPETYMYALNRDSEYSLSFLARKRVNRFQTVTERMPELRFNLKDQKLLDIDIPVYFKTDTIFSSLNKKTGDSAEDSDVIRFDTYNKLSSAFRLADFFSISPFVGMRDTGYSKDIYGDEDKIRTAFYTGIDISTRFSKTYDAQGNFMGVDFNKLHHLVIPTIEYRYIHQPSLDTLELQQFDDIDNIDQKSTYTLGLENRLQTKRLFDGSLKTVDLGYLLITGDYLYKPEGRGSQFSNVKADLELTPFKWLRIESDTLYNPDTRDFQTWNTDFYINKSEDWQLGFGSRYWQDTETELTSELFYKLNNEWSFRTFGRYDLKEVEDDGHKIINRFKDKEITVIKDLHCWLAETSLSISRDGGTTLWLVMKLKASPRVPFDFKDYYPHPK